MDKSMRSTIINEVNVHSAAKIGWSSIYPAGNKYTSGAWIVSDWNKKQNFFDGREEALDFFFEINKI